MTETELDRLRELANIGAGHAATAFGTLTQRTIWMDAPRVVLAEARGVAREAADLPTRETAVAADVAWSTGVFFEFEGYLDALVGILFHASASEEVVRSVVGMSEGELSPHCIESALMEVGNILASHVASAIADTVGERLLPSIPTLAMNHAEEQLAELVAARDGSHPIRIECELADRDGGLGGLLVLVPRVAREFRHGAPPPAF